MNSFGDKVHDVPGYINVSLPPIASALRNEGGATGGGNNLEDSMRGSFKYR